MPGLRWSDVLMTFGSNICLNCKYVGSDFGLDVCAMVRRSRREWRGAHTNRSRLWHG